MKPRELLLFRNYPSMDEPIISSGLGYLSIRNIMVFAIFGVISFVLYKLIIPDNFILSEHFILFIITVSPVILGMSLAFVKPQWGSADSIILSILYMSQRNKKHKVKLPKKSKIAKSSVLGFGDILNAKKISDEDTMREITCADFDEIKSLKITLYKRDGKIYADKLVKCYLDDILIDTLHTSLDGILLVKIRPESAGKKKLVIKTDDDDIILEKLLYFKRK